LKYQSKGGISVITIKKIFSGRSEVATSENDNVYREWERLRSNATTSSERAEIDAIFSRNF
jgi:hypothetical protein